MSQIEDLQLEHDSLLCKQSIDRVVELCGYFEVEDPVDKKSRSELVKIIRKDVENTVSMANDYFDVDILLQDAISKIKGTSPFISFIFTCFKRFTLQQSWFSRGPPSKGKKYIYKVKYNSIINRGEKVAQT